MWLGLKVLQQSKGYGEDGPNSNSSGRKEDIICGGDASIFKERGHLAGAKTRWYIYFLKSMRVQLMES